MPEHLAPGLFTVRLPGRCQVVEQDPLTLMDVAHNADSATALAGFLDAHPVSGRTHGVFGILVDKALDAVLADLGKAGGLLALGGYRRRTGAVG